MKERKIYYRNKEHKTIIEGKLNGKTYYIWTLPSPEKLIFQILAKSSYLTKEKLAEIIKKFECLDIKEDKPKKEQSKVPILQIMRSSDKDDNQTIISEEDKKKLWEMTKE